MTPSSATRASAQSPFDTSAETGTADGVLRCLRQLRRTAIWKSRVRIVHPEQRTKKAPRGDLLYLAEREGLLALRARPSGRRRLATAFSAACGSSVEPPFGNRGFESFTRSSERKRPHAGTFYIWRRERDYSRCALALRAAVAWRRRSPLPAAAPSNRHLEIEGSNRSPGAANEKGPTRGHFIFGGERGIRTLDTRLTYTHFPGVLLQPLGHLSKSALRPAGEKRSAQA